MTTPDSNLTPKNYIVSGISKNLLTPCRRVGLSRSKKTKNSITEIPIPDNEIATTPIITNKDFTLKKDVDLDSTPKQSCSHKLERSKAKADLSKVQTLEKDKQLVKTAQSLLPVNEKSCAKRPKNKLLQKEIRSTTVTSKKSSSATKYVELDNNPEDENEVQTNNIKRVTNTCLEYDDEFNTPKRHKQQEASAISHTQSHVSPENTNEDVQPHSPSISTLVQNVTVQVHKPAAKRNINFSKISQDQESLQSRVNASYSESYTQERTMNSKEHLEPLRKSKKRKLNSDSFVKTNNEQFSDPKNILFPVEQNSESNNSKPTRSNGMARFNTEDYLTEYSKSPTIFPKYLEQEYSNTINDDDLNDFMPSKEIKFMKIKSDSEEKKASNSYVAILCPSITSEAEVNNGIMQPYKASKEIPPKTHLINSLEQVSNKSINKEDIKLNTKKFDSILDKKTIASTKSSIENDCDQEIFTSSPESDKKQRENLLRLISTIEIEVKQKEETLERLKQARVYKKIHSPEKVSKSSDRWLEACKIGLTDLLMKMQELGPMDMENLIKNLKIPDHITEKLELL